MFQDPRYGELEIINAHISNASVAREVPIMHSTRLLKFHPYIYGGESSKFMKFPMDSSSFTQSFFPLL